MKWRCKSNGVIIELEDRDTNDMLAHTGYELVKVEKKVKKKEVKSMWNSTKGETS